MGDFKRFQRQLDKEKVGSPSMKIFGSGLCVDDICAV